MISLTDKALEVVRGYIDQSEGEFTALRIGIAGGTPLSPDFELTLVGTDDIGQSEVEVAKPMAPTSIASRTMAHICWISSAVAARRGASSPST